MAQRAAVGVSVLEFRGVTSLVIVQDSTPKFEAMSIEKSDFTACSQYVLARASQNRFRKDLFFVYCPANPELSPAATVCVISSLPVLKCRWPEVRRTPLLCVGGSATGAEGRCF